MSEPISDEESALSSGPSPLPPCPLCGEGAAEPFDTADGREYLHCPVCRLIFVPQKYWPSPSEERARYDMHQNAPDDEGYISFLETIAAPLANQLLLEVSPPGANPTGASPTGAGSTRTSGLDYGCGPEPVLCRLLQERGFTVHPYDPHYFPENPEGPFDFIVSTETFEHFRHPRREIERIRALLRPGGLLGVMTAFWSEEVFRANWHYRRDFTHLCFYRRETIEWICDAFEFETLWSDEKRAVILRLL